MEGVSPTTPGKVSFSQCGRELVDVDQSTLEEAIVTSCFHLWAESGTLWASVPTYSVYNSG